MNKKVEHKIQEIVFGINPIIELLSAKKRSLHALYTTKPLPKSWSIIEKLLPKNIQVHYVPREALTRMAQTADHQGVVGYTTALPVRNDLLAASVILRVSTASA